MNDQHTDTPWKIVSYKGGPVYIENDDYTIVRMSTIRPECTANARFIVEACNNHDALVAALKAILKNNELGEYESQHQGLPRMIEVRTMARQALANIESKPGPPSVPTRPNPGRPALKSKSK